MPAAHLSIFLKKSIFDELDGFDENFKISSDFDFLCRMYKVTQNFYKFKNNVGEFHLGGVSGKSERFLEDHYILRKNNVNLVNACFITLLKYAGFFVRHFFLNRIKLIAKNNKAK